MKHKHSEAQRFLQDDKRFIKMKVNEQVLSRPHANSFFASLGSVKNTSLTDQIW